MLLRKFGIISFVSSRVITKWVFVPCLILKMTAKIISLLMSQNDFMIGLKQLKTCITNFLLFNKSINYLFCYTFRYTMQVSMRKTLSNNSSCPIIDGLC